MRTSFWDEQASNKRATAALVFLMALLLAAVGAGFVFFVEPSYWWLGAGGALMVGLMYASFLPKSGAGWILSLSGAREATRDEHRALVNVGHEMAIAAGIPMPKIYVIEDSAPNAFATGWEPRQGVVCFTTGILSKLNRDELQGVMAHEISHVRNYDTRLMMTLALTVGLIVFLRDAFFRMTFRGSRRRGSDSGGSAVLAVLVVLLMILAPLLAVLLKMAVSRKREFLADASAAQLTRYPDALADALEKLEADTEPLEAANNATMHMFIVNPFKKVGMFGDTNLFGTHPPTKERVRRLRAMGLKMHGRSEKRAMPPMPDIPMYKMEDE